MVFNVSNKVQKSINVEDVNGNKGVIRAIVVEGQERINKQKSNDLGDDAYYFNVGGQKIDIIEPPLPLKTLSKLPQNNTELVQCIAAMETNIEGFGQRVIPREMTDDQKVEFENEIERETAELQVLVDMINYDGDLTNLRRKTRNDLETSGFTFWEILPNVMGDKLGSIIHIESRSMRLTKMDDSFTPVEKTVIGKDFKRVTRTFQKRFRRFVQGSESESGKCVYFKEWDDPRIIDKRDGSVSDENLPKENRATGLMYFRIYTPDTMYGLPRLVGNLFSVWGSRLSDQLNYATFTNNNIPSMVVSVSNGMLTDGSIKRIEEFVKSQITSNDNMSKFLILEAETADDDVVNAGAMKIEITPLQDTQRDDQMFQKYDENNAEKVRRSFRLPPIFVGRSNDLNRSTADASRRLADEQVFGPERNYMDNKINEILVHMGGFTYVKIKSNSPNVTDDEVLVKMLSQSEKTGGMTPNIGREILSDVFNRQIPKIDKEKSGFDPDIPFSLTIADAVKKKDGIAPNQGQIPKGDGDGPMSNVDKMVDDLMSVERDFDSEIENDIYQLDGL